MGLGWGNESLFISGGLLVLWARVIQFPWGGSYSVSKGLVSLDSIFMGTALVSLGFNGVGGGSDRWKKGFMAPGRSYFLGDSLRGIQFLGG